MPIKVFCNHRLLIVLLSFALTACANGINRSEPRLLNSNLGNFLEICEISPAPDSHTATLDQQITLTFNQKIDAYSADPSNFEIWSSEGSRVPQKPFISSWFVPAPAGCSDFAEVSQLRITPNQFLSPHERYYVMWKSSEAGASNNVSSKDMALGVYGISGDPLLNGSVAFTTSDDLSSFRRNDLEALSITPGKLLSSHELGNEKSNFFEAFRDYVTLSKKAPVSITFSEPIRHMGFDPRGELSLEIPRTPISEFPGLAIAIVDSETPIDEFIRGIGKLDSSAWTEFKRITYERIKGTVRTINNRRTLVFELDRNCDFPEECEYPDTVTQTVVALVQGFIGEKTGRAQKNDIIAGAFIHFSGYELPFGFPSVNDVIEDIFAE